MLNPSVIVDPSPFTEALALEGAEAPGTLTSLSEWPLGNAHACIGVGRCRSSTGGFMCPSFRASQDEKDSTRGRARVLQDLARAGTQTAVSWSQVEVRESMDLCLSCKACATDCPTGVDMAEAKSQLMDAHYRGRVRPFTHYAIGRLPQWLPLLSRVAKPANWAARVKLLRYVGERLGVSARRRLPAFVSAKDIERALGESEFVADPEANVLVFVDSFTRAFRPEIVPAAVRVLRSTGQTVGCSPEACCGLSWISTGQRAVARRCLRHLIQRLDDGTERAIVVLEPSCAATIRDEGPKLVGGPAAHRVADRVVTFALSIAEATDRGWTPPSSPPAAAVVQTHCHEHAVFGSKATRRVLDNWGMTKVVESTSCCGVAGNFGFETRHFEMSMKVAEHSIASALRQVETGPVITDGFSCAVQAAQIDSDRGSVHLALALDPLGHRADPRCE